MFEAVRTFAKRNTNNAVYVKDENNNMIQSDILKAEMIKEWYSNQFSSRDTALEPFDGPARPLNYPITPSEVEYAAKRLKNGRATGPDSIPNELLKYAPTLFSEKYAQILNECFTKKRISIMYRRSNSNTTPEA